MTCCHTDRKLVEYHGFLTADKTGTETEESIEQAEPLAPSRARATGPLLDKSRSPTPERTVRNSLGTICTVYLTQYSDSQTCQCSQKGRGTNALSELNENSYASYSLSSRYST